MFVARPVVAIGVLGRSQRQVLDTPACRVLGLAPWPSRPLGPTSAASIKDAFPRAAVGGHARHGSGRSCGRCRHLAAQLAALARLLAADQLDIPIARAYPLEQVRDAYRELERWPREDRRVGALPWLGPDFIERCTHGFDAYRALVVGTPWSELVEQSGIAEPDIRRLADSYLASSRVIIAWCLGLTQHEHGVDTVREIVNVLLLRETSVVREPARARFGDTATCRATARAESITARPMTFSTGSARSMVSNRGASTEWVPSTPFRRCTAPT